MAEADVLKVEKIEISHDVTEWSLSRPLSWILTVLTFAVHLRIHSASNFSAKFRSDRPYSCRKNAIFSRLFFF